MEYKFTYTRLLVDNFKDCFMFYRDMLGFKPTFGSEEDVYADFDTGAVTLALFSRQNMNAAIAATDAPPEVKGQDPMCLIFEVKDVDAACEELKKKGVGLVAEPTDHPDWGVRTAHFRDPAGNLVEINQPFPHQ